MVQNSVNIERVTGGLGRYKPIISGLPSSICLKPYEPIIFKTSTKSRVLIWPRASTLS